MTDDLKALSDRARPGQLFVTKSSGERSWQEAGDGVGGYTMAPADDDRGATLSTDPRYAGWCTDGGCDGYMLDWNDAEFLAALWNAYRAGRLVAAPVPAEPDQPPARMFSGWSRTLSNGNMLEVYWGLDGWWAILHRRGWRLDRGPYPLEAMARLAFPVQRFTWRGGNGWAR